MRRALGLVLAGLLVGALGVAASSTQRSTAEEGPALRVSRVVLRPRHLEVPTVLAAWVQTGSDSRKCLVTLLESNVASFGETVFCGLRFVHGKPGVWVHVFLPFEPPTGFRFDVAVYQQGASMYGRPIPCPGIEPNDLCFA